MNHQTAAPNEEQASKDMSNGVYGKAESIFKESIGNEIDKDDSFLREKFNLSVCLNRQGKFA